MSPPNIAEPDDQTRGGVTRRRQKRKLQICVGFIVRGVFGVSLRRRLAIAVRSVGRDPHSAHLLPQDGYTLARKRVGVSDTGVVVLSHERLRR